MAALVACARSAGERVSARYVDVNGVHTYYETHASGPPVVLLHGAAMVAEGWRAQIEALAPHFTVYVPERRGVGRTADIAGEWSYAGMAADTAALMDKLELQHASVIGLSDGGIIGLILAATRPDLVAALVVSGANRNADGLVPDLRATEKLTPQQLIEGAPPQVQPWLAIHRQVSPDRGVDLPRSFAKMQRMWFDFEIPLAQLGSIRARTLVMAGDHDMVPVSHTVEIWSAIPNAQLCIAPNASHFWLMEQPELANRVLLDFLLARPETHQKAHR